MDSPMSMIIHVPEAKRHFPRRQVFPRRGELVLRCGHCGTMDQFRAHIAPDVATGSGRVSELVCMTCTNVWKVTDQALLEGGGKVDKQEKAKPCHD